MNIVCDQQKLNQAVAIVARAASNKDILDILGGILLEADQDTLTLTSTNLDFTIQCHLPCTVNKAGSVILPAVIFQDIVRKSSASELNIEVDTSNFKAKIFGKNFRIELAGLPGVDFPALQETELLANMTFPAKSLANMLNDTIFATAKDDVRPIFTGVLFEIDTNKIKLSATDGFRIISMIEACEYASMAQRFVLPGRNSNEIARILAASTNENVELFFGSGQLLLDVGGIKIITKLLKGQYPDLSHYMPDSYHTTINLDGKTLQQALDRASLIIRNNLSGVVNLEVAEQTLTIKGRSQELGQHVEMIPIEHTGKSLKVSFTLRYLSDLIKHLSDARCVFRFAEDYNILVAMVDKQENDESFSLLMPVASQG